MGNILKIEDVEVSLGVLRNDTDAQLAKAIREGVNREGQHYKPPMAYGFYKNIDDADMNALIAYLRSLKPRPFSGLVGMTIGRRH